MSDLTSTLERFFSSEVGKLADVWDEDTDKIRERIARRARSLEGWVNRESTFRQRRTGRRCAVLLRLLEMEGAAYADRAPHFSLILASAIHNLEDDELRELGPLLFDLLEPLPEDFGARPRQSLVSRVARLEFDNDSSFGGLAERVKDEIGALCAEVLQRRLAEGSSPSLPLAGVDPARLYEAVHWATGAFPPEPVDRLLVKHFDVTLDRAWRWLPKPGTSAFDRVLSALPEARAEVVLLNARMVAWEYLHCCPTPAVLQQALDTLQRVNRQDYYASSNATRLVRFGLDHIGPPLDHALEDLIEEIDTFDNKSGVIVLIESISGKNAHQLLPLLERADDKGAALALVRRLRTIDPTTHREAIVEAFTDTTHMVQLALADAAAAWAHAWPIGELLDLMRERANGAAVRDRVDKARAVFEADLDIDDLVEDYHTHELSELRPTLMLRDGHPSHRWGSARSRLEPALDAVVSDPRLPWLIWAALRQQYADPRNEGLEFYEWALGERVLIGPIRRILQIPSPDATDHFIYEWLIARGQAPVELHLFMMDKAWSSARKLAARELANLGEDAICEVAPLLEAGRSAVRAAAARCLELVGSPEALPYLEAAAEGERAKAAKEAIRAAINVLRPDRTAIHEEAVDLGAYRREDAFSPNDAVAQLRQILYEEPTLTSFTQVCDLLCRLDHHGSAELAMQYLLNHGVDQWAPGMRLLPHRWKDHPTFSALGEHTHLTEVWLPVSALGFAGRDDLVIAALEQVEASCRVRKFVLSDVDTFLDALEAAWAWCEAHRVPLDHLDLRVDGGATGGVSGKTTALTLYGAFGASFSRTSVVKTAGSRSHGLRQVRVRVPGRHRLRDEHDLGRGVQHLDLTELLGLD